MTGPLRFSGAGGYGAGLACGMLLLFSLMPLDAIGGTGGLWRSPAGDMAQSLTGHLALQSDAWRLPPLMARNLFWPRGVSIALTDSNPLFSLAAKVVGMLGGGGPVNLLGAWLASCWLLQPIAAVYALRALTRSIAGAATVSVLAALFPALLVRVGHVNLCGHFLILLALGVTLRLLREETRGRWIVAGAILTAAILCHPYLFMASAATLAAVPVQAALRRPPGWWRTWPPFVVAAAIPVLLFVGLAGTLGGGDKGFVVYSMNLLSPVWPQRSGLFGADLPVIDATGGQYEGFCYLGAGSLLLLAVALPQLGALRRWPGLLAVMVALTLVALSSRVYAGHTKLLDLGVKPWEDIFAVFRASGRAFWPVGYALVVAAVAAACRLPHPARLALLAVAAVLQVIDTGPVLVVARQALAGANGAGPLPALPAGATLLSVVPTAGCSASPGARAITNPLLLAGIRAGMRLGDVGMGRAPAWFSCEAVLSDGLELPLLPREVRVFADPTAVGALRPALLGSGASCRRAEGEAVLCAAGVDPPPGAPGAPVDPGRPVLTPPIGSELTGASLAPALGWGWRDGADGAAWSEGPHATLLVGVAPGADIDLVLRMAGIGRTAAARAAWRSAPDAKGWHPSTCRTAMCGTCGCACPRRQSPRACSGWHWVSIIPSTRPHAGFLPLCTGRAFGCWRSPCCRQNREPGLTAVPGRVCHRYPLSRISPVPQLSLHSPVGDLTVSEESGAIVAIDWGWGRDQTETSLLCAATERLQAYFDGVPLPADLPLAPAGSPYRQRVWDALRAIPHGETRTYGQIARVAGGTARSVGQANSCNPIPILIPCHRVVAAAGLGGFSGGEGPQTKRALLALERALAELDLAEPIPA